MQSRSALLSVTAADPGALLEPDIAVVDYVSPPSLLDAMPLFDSTLPPAANGQRRPPSHTRPPPPLPHMPPPPPGAPQQQGRRGAPPPPPPRRGEPRPVAPSPSGTQRYPPPPPPSQTQPRQAPAAGKRPTVPSTQQQKAAKPKQPQQQKKRKRARRRVPAFDGGEVNPAQARHPPRQPPVRQPPPTGAPPVGAQEPRAAPPAPDAASKPSSAPPIPELSRAQIRLEQARLYEQQKQKYAQLVAFHRGEPGATYPSGFDFPSASAAAGPNGGANREPEQEPTLEQLREMLRADGLLTPPSAEDTAEAAEHLEGGMPSVGAAGLFSVPTPREREYDLPRLKPGHVPAWKKQQQQAGAKRRRKPVPAGAVESLARGAASLRTQSRGRKNHAPGRAQTESAFAEMKSQLLRDLSSESATLKLREEIDRLLRESLAKMTPEEMAAEIERLQAASSNKPGAPPAASAPPAAAAAAAAAAAPPAAPAAAHR